MCVFDVVVAVAAAATLLRAATRYLLATMWQSSSSTTPVPHDIGTQIQPVPHDIGTQIQPVPHDIGTQIQTAQKGGAYLYGWMSSSLLQTNAPRYRCATTHGGVSNLTEVSTDPNFKSAHHDAIYCGSVLRYTEITYYYG